MHSEERLLALAEVGSRFPTGSLLIIGVRNCSPPMISFDDLTPCDHDYYFNSPCGEHHAQSLHACDLLGTMAISGALSACEPSFQTDRSPGPVPPRPVQMTRQLSAIATFAIFRPRRMARWKNLSRHRA